MDKTPESKRRRHLQGQPSNASEVSFSATGQVTEDDMVDGCLVCALALENLHSFRDKFPGASVLLGLSPCDTSDEPVVLTWGSCCSGSEGVNFALQAIQLALAKNGFAIVFQHLFSCESNKTKRTWISKVIEAGSVFPENGVQGAHGNQDPGIFTDIAHMKDEAAKCESHKGKCQVKTVDVLFIGTSCKDLSRQNCHVDRSKPVLAEAMSRGGSAQTFNGLLDYCEGYRPAMVVYENVDAIDDKITANAENNLTILMNAMRTLGYRGQKIMTDAQHFGLPCRRRRLYILFVSENNSLLRFGDDGAIGRAFSKVRTSVTATMRSPPCATKCFLKESNPERAALLRKRLEEAQETAAKRQESKKAPQNTWVEKHMAHADQLGVRWAANVPQVLSQNPWFQCLTHREADALRLSRVESPHSAFRNLSQSVGRINCQSLQPDGTHVGPTMLPTQLLWIESAERIMIGEEALMFQGFPILPMMSKVELPGPCSTHAFLQDLAGNAMALPVVMAVFQAGLASFEIAMSDDEEDEEAESIQLDVETALAAVAKLRPPA